MSSQSKKKGNKSSKQSGVKKSNQAMSIKHHVKSACSILDPFCIHAKNAHNPDGKGSNSVTFQVRGSVPIVLDATGACLYLFCAGLGRYGYANSVIAAGNCTVASAWSVLPGSAFVNTNALEVRIVSFGVSFKSILSATNCSGLVHTFVTNNAFAGQVIPQMSNNNLEDTQTPLTSGFQTSFIAKPVGTGSDVFRSYLDATTTMSSFDWTSLGLEIIGGPAVASTVAGYAEIVMNVEFILNTIGTTTTGLAGISNSNKPANPVAISAQKAVHSTSPGLIAGPISKVSNMIETKVVSFLEDAADYGLSALFAAL